MSDGAIIDNEFVERLVAGGRGYRVLQNYVNHRFADEWEDVMQESLLALWKSRDTLKHRDAALGFFQGIAKNVAMSYRRRPIDRADYCEVGDWHAVVRPDEMPDSVRREQEIREAAERLERLLRKVRLRHRITFWEWRKRGYRNETKRQACDFTRMMQALMKAAGVAWEERERGHLSLRAGKEA